jgi:hypothetical protein
VTINRPLHSHLTALVLIVLIIAGCSYTPVPRSVPLLADARSGSMAGVWVLMTNGEKDDSLTQIPTDERRSSSFKANRQLWSRTLVESLAREFARRGATVRAGAPITLNVALPEIVFIETRDLYQFKVKAVVTSSRGWSKEYTGIAGVNASSVLSIQRETDRMAGQALSNVIKEMLGDDEFQHQMRTTKS